MHTSYSNIPSLVIVAVGLAAATPVAAYELSDKLSLGLSLAMAGQCQELSAGDSSDACRGAVPFQLDGSLRPAEGHELGFKLGFAAGNGINGITPFTLAPWAADLEDNVKDINGRNRDYLLAAWYRYELPLTENSTLGMAVGILDSTEYLDGNAYANDEYTQFMNEVFVNSGSYGLPSYDTGAAISWGYGDWSLSAIGMNVGKNEDGNNYTFFGGQLAYHLDTEAGPGNYRLILTGTSKDFLDPAGTHKEGRFAGGLSFDQSLGEVMGAFLRIAWQTENALVNYKSLYSGGIDLKGKAWGRDTDNIGIGYAYLPGGNGELDHTHAFEAYYRFGFTDEVAITADVQWMTDHYRTGAGVENPQGWIIGLRFAAAF